MPKLKIKHRQRIVLGVIVALFAHTLEIFIFAIAYFAMNQLEGWGSLQGNFDGSLADSVYFSFTTYTTLGFGDIEPFGGMRYLVGIESLTGLVLITWTASFLYIEMRQYWDSH
ncbi:MAG: two pore domain potassium channel family protein [Gammaproteobacteria bacterium]|nr:two pore domain potassium channel family protein [Gammaproteobacteria bacterium]